MRLAHVSICPLGHARADSAAVVRKTVLKGCFRSTDTHLYMRMPAKRTNLIDVLDRPVRPGLDRGSDARPSAHAG
jgi:hypothetical protein